MLLFPFISHHNYFSSRKVLYASKACDAITTNVTCSKAPTGKARCSMCSVAPIPSCKVNGSQSFQPGSARTASTSFCVLEILSPKTFRNRLQNTQQPLLVTVY